jgi:adenosylhomocysteine nucleosidase
MAIAAPHAASLREMAAVDPGPWRPVAELGAAAAAAASASRGRLGIVMGLHAEAECLRRSDDALAPLTCITGGSALRARHGAEELREQGVAALVSFGLAIGLAPVLRPGDVVIADRVVLPGGVALPTDAAWRAALLQRLAGSDLKLRVARVAGSDQALTTATTKRRAFQSTFAAALDTESHAVAEVAAAGGLPLLVVRAVAEPVETMRPGIAFAAVGDDGQTRSLAMMGHLARRPWEIPAAWRFSKNGRRALEALRRVAAVGLQPFAFAST